jgi:hypothetical protein
VWVIDQVEVWRTPSACESANLADRSSDAIELATNGSGTRFRGKETKAITGAKFTKAQKNTINHSKGPDVLLQLVVEAAHDEANDGLQKQTSDLPSIKDVRLKSMDDL